MVKRTPTETNKTTCIHHINSKKMMIPCILSRWMI